MMPPGIADKKGLVVDTNLLLLYLVGRQDIGLIPRFKKRLSGYSPDDFNLLAQFIARFKVNVTTPNVLTEISNFLNGESEPYRNVLAQLPVHLVVMQEYHFPSFELIGKDAVSFAKFGLTDAALIELAKQNYIILTQDRNLAAYISGKGYTAFDFALVRALLIQKGPPPKRRTGY